MVKAGLDAIHYSGVSGMLAPALRGLGCIFCLHEVRGSESFAPGFSPNYQLAITPEFLDEAITMAKKQGYALVSLGELADILSTGKSPSKPVAVFTLDDGYKNNAVNAVPVFRAHNCPYTIFVSPGFADATQMLWWIELERLIAREVEVDGIPCDTPQRKTAAWRKLAEKARYLEEHEQRTWLASLLERAGLNWVENTRAIMMDWSEIRSLAMDPFCTIGAHTNGHFALKRLEREQAAFEILDSKKRIEKELAQPVEFFAYPYGDRARAGLRDFELSRQAGFKAAVTTRKGVITSGHRQHMQALPRIMMSGRYQKTRQLKVLMAGFPLYLQNRLRRTIVE